MEDVMINEDKCIFNTKFSIGDRIKYTDFISSIKDKAFCTRSFKNNLLKDFSGEIIAIKKSKIKNFLHYDIHYLILIDQELTNNFGFICNQYICNFYKVDKKYLSKRVYDCIERAKAILVK